MKNPKSGHISMPVMCVAWFTLGYIVLAAPWSLLVVNLEFFIYSIEMVLIFLLAVVLHKRNRLHVISLWCMSLWGILHLAGGLVLVPSAWPTSGRSHVLYNLWLAPGLLKYDQFVHAYGFAVVTWVCWQVLSRLTKPGEAGLEMFLASVTTSLGVGAFNETVEFVATLALPLNNVGDYANYGWDLVFNAIGSIAAGVVLWHLDRRRPASEVPMSAETQPQLIATGPAEHAFQGCHRS